MPRPSTAQQNLIISLINFRRALIRNPAYWHVKLNGWISFKILRFAQYWFDIGIRVAIKMPRFIWRYCLIFVLSLLFDCENWPGHFLLGYCDLSEVCYFLFMDILLKLDERVRVFCVVISRVEIREVSWCITPWIGVNWHIVDWLKFKIIIFVTLIRVIIHLYFRVITLWVFIWYLCNVGVV